MVAHYQGCKYQGGVIGAVAGLLPMRYSELPGSGPPGRGRWAALLSVLLVAFVEILLGGFFGPSP
jgi:hypothetical protein